MGQLAGKIAIVTGGAKGIGAAIVKRYVEEGAQLVIAKTEKPPKEAKGDAISFTISPDMAHYFDKDTGQRLES